MPMRHTFATDSAAMKGKAEDLIEKARKLELLEAQGKKANGKKPSKKPFNVQKDGDLWHGLQAAIKTKNPFCNLADES